MIKIFVVEDDTDLNRFVSSSLRGAGYDVVSLFDGLQALEKMDEEKYYKVLENIILAKEVLKDCYKPKHAGNGKAQGDCPGGNRTGGCSD